MAKAIFVFDEPETCGDCPLCSAPYPECQAMGGKTILDDEISGEPALYTRPEWCPLKPAPKKNNSQYSSYRWKWFRQGWNACIDKILGGMGG